MEKNNLFFDIKTPEISLKKMLIAKSLCYFVSTIQPDFKFCNL